ncbi:hypothetical protein TKK_0000303 [Trichogramma kaykai]
MQTRQLKLEKKYLKSLEPEANPKHLILKKAKFNLENQLQSAEGTTYGFGPTQMNKLFRILQLPNIDEKVLKSYERIVSSIVELIDEESILKAADLERTLTIENKSTLVKLLPDSHEKDFLVNDPEPLSNSQDSINDPIVKIFVFFDMDNDSSCIASIEKEIDYAIVKLSDMNRTNKRVSDTLHTIHDSKITDPEK